MPSAASNLDLRQLRGCTCLSPRRITRLYDHALEPAGISRAGRLRRRRPAPHGLARRLPHPARGADLPGSETACTVTPLPLNPLGVKGIGAKEALSPLGVTDLAMPLTAGMAWRAIRAGGRRGLRQMETG